MFFFGTKSFASSPASRSNAIVKHNWVTDLTDWYVPYVEEGVFNDIDSFLCFEPLRINQFSKPYIIEFFAHTKAFYVNLLLISFWNSERLTEFIKNSLRHFIESLVKDKTVIFQKQILTIFFEQDRIIGKIKALFPPLNIIPNSLRPIKFAA